MCSPRYKSLKYNLVSVKISIFITRASHLKLFSIYRSEVWAVDFQNGNLDTCFSVHDIFYFVNVSFLTSDIYMCTTNVPSRYEVSTTNYFFLYAHVVMAMRINVSSHRETNQVLSYLLDFKLTEWS